MKNLKRSKSKAGWLLYVMIHVPFFWWCKIGITGKTSRHRAKQIDRAVFGFPIPVFILIMPGAYHFEQWLHRALSGLRVRFYKGDGASEWFWLPAGLVAIGLASGVWAIYFVAGMIIFNSFIK